MGPSQPSKKALGAEQPQWRFINAALKSGVAKGVFTKNGGKYKVVKVKAAPKKKRKPKRKKSSKKRKRKPRKRKKPKKRKQPKRKPKKRRPPKKRKNPRKNKCLLLKCI